MNYSFVSILSILCCFGIVQSANQPTIWPTAQKPTLYPSLLPPTYFPTVIEPTFDPTITPTTDFPTVEPTNAPVPTTRPTVVADYPKIFPSLIGTASTKYISVQVNTSHSSSGTLYCAAVSSSTELTSTSIIKSDGYQTLILTDSHDLLTITILSLNPVTQYDIYCYTEDLFGNKMPLSEAIETKLTMSTLCCNSVSFTSSNALIPEYNPITSNGVLPSVWSFELDALPKSDMSFQATITSITSSCEYALSGSASIAQVTPKLFKFTNTSTSLSKNFVISSSTPGCYVLSIIPSSTTYSGVNQSVSVYSSSTTLTPPKLLSGQFSNDGRKIYVSFDTPTNRGRGVISDLDTSFDCSQLLVFPDAASSLCIFTSDSDLIITLGSYASTGVGDKISIAANVLRALCTSSSVCSDFSNSVEYISILVPDSPISPQAVLSSPSPVSVCNGITLDPMTTRGSAGRAWKYIHWLVSISPLTSSTSLKASRIAWYLNSNYTTTNSLVSIPGSYLPNGVTLTISLQVTNFLSQSAAASVSITISSIQTYRPIVSIVGNNIISIYRNQSLTIQADGEIVNCNTNEVLNISSSMTYQWRVFTNNIDVSDTYPSQSKNPKVYYAPTHSFTPGITYSIEVTLTIDNGLTSTSRSIVQVGTTSGITATITGGTRRIVSVHDASALIDASLSQLNDYPDQSLSYQWLCESQMIDTYGESCDFDGSPIRYTTSSTLLISLNNIQIDSNLGYNQYQITVVVSFGTISQTTSMTLLLTDSIIPKITFESLDTKYNSNSKIFITGLLSMNSTEYNEGLDVSLVNAYWSLMNAGGSPLQLSSIALTPINYTSLTWSNTTNQHIYIQLGLKPYGLTPGLTYTFRLTSSYTNNPIYQSSNDVTIVINEPPTGGNLAISPSIGYNMKTVFLCYGSNWNDDVDDYPLKYLFYYQINGSNLINLIQSYSPLQYVNTIIGQGLQGYDYHVIVYLNVSDRYDSISSIQSSINVYPVMNYQLNQSDIINQFESSYQSKNINEMLVAMSSINTYISNANCSLKTYQTCQLFNRYSCSYTTNTCGKCYDGYVGRSGDSNSLCQRPDQVKKINSICTHDNDCNTNYCMNGICSYPNKTCTNDCSFHGQCVYQSITNTSKFYSSCTEDQIDCQPVCQCNQYYYGKDCSMDESEYETVQAIKDSMCTYLSQSLIYLDIGVIELQSIISLLTDTFNDPSLVSSNGYETCFSLVSGLMVTYSEYLGSIDLSYLVSPLLNNLVTSQASYSGSSYQDLLIDMIDIYHQGIQNNLAINENSIEISNDYYRSTIQVISTSTINNASFTLSKTTSESTNDITSPSIRLESTGSSYDSIGVSLDKNSLFSSSSLSSSISSSIGIRLIPYESSSSSTSSRRMLATTNSDCSNNQCLEAAIIIPNDESQQYQTIVGQSHQYHCLVTNSSSSSSSYVISSNCTSLNGTIYTFECPGNREVLVRYSCPNITQEPRIYSSSDNGNSYELSTLCQVNSYSSTKTIGTCSLTQDSSSIASFRRLLVDSSHRILSTSSEKQNLIVSLEIIESDFVSTWETITTIEPGAFSKNITITVVTSVFLAIMIGGFIYHTFHDISELKNSKAVKNLLNLSPSNPSIQFLKQGMISSPAAITPTNKNDKNVLVSLNSLFDTIMPIEFTSLSWYDRFIIRLTSEHDWFGMVFNYHHIHDFKSYKWMKATGTVLHYMFLDTILAGLIFQDDGTCQGFLSQSTCQQQNSLNQIDSLCEWNSSSQTCSFNENIGMNTIGSLILTTIMTLLVIPLDLFYKNMLLRSKGFITNLIKTRMIIPIAEEISDHSNSEDGSKKMDISTYFKNLQTYHGILYRAARLVKLQQRFDVEIDDEIMMLNNACTNPLSSVRRHPPAMMQLAPLANHKKNHLGSELQIRIDQLSPQASISTAVYTFPSDGSSSKSTNSNLAIPVSSDIKQPIVIEGRVDSSIPNTMNVIGSETRRLGIKDYQSSMTMNNQSTNPNNHESQSTISKAIKRKDDTIVRSNPNTNQTTKLDLFQTVNILQTSLSQPKDPIIVTKFLSSLPHDQRINYLTKLIKTSRTQADEISNKLTSITKENLQEIYLLQQFLIHCLSGFQQTIAKRYFFKDYQQYYCPVDGFYSAKMIDVILESLSIVFLPLYIIGMILYIFLFGWKIGNSGTIIWLQQLAISVLQTTFILQPIRIWLEFIILSSFAGEIRIWLNLLKTRSKNLMQRSNGLVLYDENTCFIQHVNPACRTAQKYPQLSISRLIMALNDYDLPTSFMLDRHDEENETKIRKISKYWLFLLLLLVSSVTLLPEFIQASLLEAYVNSTLNIIALIIAFLKKESWVGPFIISFVISCYIGYRVICYYYYKKQYSFEKDLTVDEDDDEEEEEEDEDEDESNVLRNNKPKEDNPALLPAWSSETRTTDHSIDILSSTDTLHHNQSKSSKTNHENHTLLKRKKKQQSLKSPYRNPHLNSSINNPFLPTLDENRRIIHDETGKVVDLEDIDEDMDSPLGSKSYSPKSPKFLSPNIKNTMEQNDNQKKEVNRGSSQRKLSIDRKLSFDMKNSFIEPQNYYQSLSSTLKLDKLTIDTNSSSRPSSGMKKDLSQSGIGDKALLSPNRPVSATLSSLISRSSSRYKILAEPIQSSSDLSNIDQYSHSRPISSGKEYDELSATWSSPSRPASHGSSPSPLPERTITQSPTKKTTSIRSIRVDIDD